MTVIPKTELPTGGDIPALGLGTWFIGEAASEFDREVSALRYAMDRGIRLIDTAECTVITVQKRLGVQQLNALAYIEAMTFLSYLRCFQLTQAIKARLKPAIRVCSVWVSNTSICIFCIGLD